MIDEPARRGTADRAGPGQDDGVRHARTVPHSARTGSAGDRPRCAAHSEVMRRPTFAVMSGLSAVVLALSYHSSTGTPAGTAIGSTPVSGSTGSSSRSSSGSSSGSSGSISGSSAGTYTGNAVDTQWGTVQVQITVAKGKITKADAVQYPQNNGRDLEINSYAVPQLDQEAVAAGNASIDAVSGATVS